MTPDIPSFAACKAVHDVYVQIALKHCRQGREVQPQCLLVQVNDTGKITQSLGLSPTMMHFFFGDEEGKQKFAYYLKHALQPGHPMMSASPFRANIIVHVHETWRAPSDTHPATGKRIMPSEHPERKEAIMIGIHTREKTYVTSHPILSNPRRAELKAFTDMGWGPGDADVKVSGRFIQGGDKEDT